MMFEPVNCCICDNHNIRVYATDWKGFQIVECKECKLRFVSPRPSLETLLEKVYQERYYDNKIKDISQMIFNDEYYTYLEIIEKKLGKKGLILDVGTGAGKFLLQAQKMGWEVEGTDISSTQVEYLRGVLKLNVHFGLLEKLGLPEKYYDAITLNNVLEHTQNPKTTLLECRKILKPGGIIFMILPNTGGLNDLLHNLISSCHLTSKPYKHLACDHHHWFFTLTTIRLLFARVDLDVVYLRSTFDQKRLCNPIRRWYAKFGLGSRIEAVVQKKS